MSKQPLQTACFEDAFLKYLQLRFEFEPLPHYVMAAIQVCNHTGRSFPDFVRGFLDWFSDRFLSDDIGRKGEDVGPGVFPVLTSNRDKAPDQWRRYEDCHELLIDWLDGDPTPALATQSARFELVTMVEEGRHKTDEKLFAELQEYFGEPSYTLKRRYQAMTEPKRGGTSGIIPIALVQGGDGYKFEVREMS